MAVQLVTSVEFHAYHSCVTVVLCGAAFKAKDMLSKVCILCLMLARE